MISNENKVKRKIQLRHIKPTRREINIPKEVLKKAEEAVAEKKEPQLTADQLAILFICQRGHQSLISILQGVNSTRIPIGKKPLDDKAVRKILTELEKQGFLTKVELQDQPAWTVTAKARELET